MTRNPLVNALSAAGYIVFIASTMFYVTQPLRNKPNTFIAPITVLFVLTFSISVMAYLFFYQPTAVFGSLTLIIPVLLFLGII
jgi:hypothetical protein